MHAQGQFSRRLRSFSLAFGPQHPAAHGILRFNCLLQGETIRHLDSLFGFLHRGSEKLMEQRTCLQSLPYFDRFDYVANFQQEHAFCLAVEALSVPRLFLEGPSLALRVLFDEVGRVLNHLLTLSATALDMGVMGPIF
jgi:NADH-quinone oxidoreductase subunit D